MPTTPVELREGAAAVEKQALQEAKAAGDSNVFDLQVKATCKPPPSLHSPTGHPQLQCRAELWGRVLGLDSPIDPRRDLVGEKYVVDVTSGGYVLGAGSADNSAPIAGALEADHANGCFKAVATDPTNVPTGCG